MMRILLLLLGYFSLAFFIEIWPFSNEYEALPFSEYEKVKVNAYFIFQIIVKFIWESIKVPQPASMLLQIMLGPKIFLMLIGAIFVAPLKRVILLSENKIIPHYNF